MDDRELYWAALERAAHLGENAQIRALRDYIHVQTSRGAIATATRDQLGELIDEIAALFKSEVGDVIGPHEFDIPWDVVEVVDNDNDTWQRAFGEDRLHIEDDGSTNGFEYDWCCTGGHTTTGGLLGYGPLRVTAVVEDGAVTRLAA